MSRGRPILLYLPGAKELAEKIHHQLPDWQLIPLDAHYFDDGELIVRIPEDPKDQPGKNSVGGADVYILQTVPYLSPRSRQDLFLEMAWAISAATGCRANKRVAVMPWFHYACQERRRRREPITARKAADILQLVGTTEIMMVDIHDKAIEGFFDDNLCPPLPLYSTSLLLKHLEKKHQFLSQKEQFLIANTDAGGQKLVKHLAKHFDLKRIEAEKDKDYKRDQAIGINIKGRADGKIVVVFDDIVRGSTTIVGVIEALGVPSIIAATHADFCKNAVTELDRLYQEKLLLEAIFTDSFTFPPEFAESHPWFVQISLAELLAETIKQLHQKGSVSYLYEADYGLENSGL